MPVKLEKWALIAQIVGSVAVVLSIIYLTVEVQRNTSAIRSETQRGLLDLVAQELLLVASDDAIADLYLRAEEDLDSVSPVERERYARLVLHNINVWEHAFNSNRKGNMDRDDWAAWDRGYRFLICNESSNRIWNEIAERYPDTPFLAYLNAVEAEVCPGAGP